MLVYAVYGKAVEHIEGAHPLRVTLGEVVVDGNHVNALSGKCVEEHREGSHQGLTFTGCHFGNHAPLLLVGFDAAVEDYTADELDVVVNHVPGNLIAAGLPVVVPHSLVAGNLHKVAAFGGKLLVKFGGRNLHGLILGKTAGRRFHDGKSLRKEFIQNHFNGFVLFLHKFVALRCKGLLFLYGNVFLYAGLELRYAVFEGLLYLEDTGTESGAALSQAVVGQGVYFRVCGKDLVKIGPDSPHVTVTL